MAITLEGVRSVEGVQYSPPIFRDQFTSQLVNYMASYLNIAFAPVIAVKTSKDYNAFRVPNDQYPLLKCYRNRDTAYPNTLFSTTNVTLEHCIVYPKDEDIGAISTLISGVIKEGLIEPQFYDLTGIKIDWSNQVVSDYKIAYNENYEPVINYVSVNFSIFTAP